MTEKKITPKAPAGDKAAARVTKTAEHKETKRVNAKHIMKKAAMK